MGFDTFEVQDILNEKGIWENSMDLFTEAASNPNYLNVLKTVAHLPIYGQHQNPYNRL